MAGSQVASGRVRAESRAWLLGPLATGLGWAAHVLGGGASPAPLIVVALGALLGMVTAIGRPGRLPGWGLLLASGVVQQLLHLAFAALSVSTGVDLPGHGHGRPEAADPNTQGAHPAGAADLHLLLYLHMAAALLTAYAAGLLEKSTVHRRQRVTAPGIDSGPSGQGAR
jgi:hypothetical protein